MERPPIERRRRDPMNRMRRAAYGMLLAMGAPMAAASGGGSVQQAPLSASPADAQEEQTNFAALVFIRGQAIEQAQPTVFGASYTRAALGESSEQALSPVPLPIRSGLLTLSFSDEELRRWRKGAGLDITVPDVGQFRLNFFSRGGQALKRWSLSPPGPEDPSASKRYWSAAASIDWAKTGDGQKRQLVFVPKLVINAAELLDAESQFDICIQYAQWRSREAGNLGEVPQAVLRWAF